MRGQVRVFAAPKRSLKQFWRLFDFLDSKDLLLIPSTKHVEASVRLTNPSWSLTLSRALFRSRHLHSHEKLGAATQCIFFIRSF